MDIKEMIRKGLLGYQPIFFPNGIISGTGFQFFGNLRSMRAAVAPTQVENTPAGEPSSIKVNASFNFNQGRLGNLYIPPRFGDHSEFNTEFYYCVDEIDVGHFARYNVALLEMYKYFAAKSLEIARGTDCSITSMIEIGANTCLFPFAFAEAGIKDCWGTDIVDYSAVVDLLSAIKNTNVSFLHMADDSDETWKGLPKADLVWSYAVLLHQSNPLAHLARLASLAKKAMFVMTLCDPDDWKSDQEMALRYLSANSYYNADFPNCFDVTIVSPALIKYSLQRLGFSRIVEIPHPEFEILDETSRADLKYWLKKHCFYLAFRDTPRDVSTLDDYSVSAERSPFKGENILVHAGYHHNIVLRNSRYYIVPHGNAFAGDGHDPSLASFASLTRTMQHFNNLDAERNPQPILLKALKSHNVIRYKHEHYLCPHGRHIDFRNAAELEPLHVLDTLEKWEALLDLVGEKKIGSLGGVVVDFIDGMCVTRSKNGEFAAKHVGPGGQAMDIKEISSGSLDDLRKRIVLRPVL